jgi:hypothetical protein
MHSIGLSYCREERVAGLRKSNNSPVDRRSCFKRVSQIPSATENLAQVAPIEKVASPPNLRHGVSNDVIDLLKRQPSMLSDVLSSEAQAE